MSPRNASESELRPQPAGSRSGRAIRCPSDDTVTDELPRSQVQPEIDRVVRTRFAGAVGVPAARRQRATPLVLPGWRHIATLAAPDAVVSLSLLMAVAVASVTSAFSVWFVVPLIVPSIVLGAFDRTWFGHGWRVAVATNLSTLLLLFPLLVIRQSAVRVPYLDGAHGTVFAAVVFTVAVLVALVGIALFSAWAARQNPESAPTLFLPAALMVPLLTSATEFARLETALLVAGVIFAAAGGLTLLASMLPSDYTVFVAPIAVAAEVVYVAVVRQDRIFPVGVGEAGMALFATVIIAAIALVVVVPGISAWMLRVDLHRIRSVQQTG